MGTGPGAGKRLVGVGVGPGDPELVTVRAVRRLREADVVLVPVMAPDEPGRAEATVRCYVPDGRIERVVFALNDRGGGRSARRVRAWEEAARTVLRHFGAGAASVAFATIGDPNIYSTFGYLAQTVRETAPGAEIETVAGITAMQDLATRSGTVLVEGSEPLTLLPVTAGVRRLREALDGDATVVAYKFGRHAPDVREALRESGRLAGAVHGSRLGLPDERIAPAAELGRAPLPYLSTLIVPARRTERGGKL
ncbi:precorrin-2 C(20)-methyltransferase [Marinitenerispora sediminis]|uniref:Precorrin-2 C(20)-methyltransferase n=1 Tax=Marinitenerispora sediminis TaxID=1931232 RepID=A0A368T5A1_9ACTN|nr:precorrin-2 C(20)-methyltransferase [Marinitenerispora sediminis]RCV54288.1 precorrin-2 C(20)-methyltransferase [Marinitenerispora sediminis]RCV56424.1 precorrin-2 C(20)-methyltransferase [Marinitenerispora sediminis]RCV58626.1 precorrin-2 C(20)-methyltransferase [Marinitenerispora sediminis]